MEITAAELYILFKFDSILEIANFFVVISAISLVIVWVFWVIVTEFDASSDDDAKNFFNGMKKFTKQTVIVFFVSGSITAFVPTTKQMAAIIILPAVINNEKVQQIPEQLLDVLGLSLDKLKNDLMEESND